MRKLIFIACVALFLTSCEKDNFDIDHPDVATFVQQIKTQTYKVYEKGENGEKLWLKMPHFTEENIPELIEFAKDTTHITKFPYNPLSSMTPFPAGRDYSILGECLLWVVEGIRRESEYASLNSYLVNTSLSENERYKGLKGADILIIRNAYQSWWDNFKDKDWKNTNPLDNTSCVWF